MNIYIPDLHTNRNYLDEQISFDSIDKTIFVKKFKSQNTTKSKHVSAKYFFNFPETNLLFFKKGDRDLDIANVIENCDAIFYFLTDKNSLGKISEVGESDIFNSLIKNKKVFIVLDNSFLENISLANYLFSKNFYKDKKNENHPEIFVSSGLNKLKINLYMDLFIQILRTKNRNQVQNQAQEENKTTPEKKEVVEKINLGNLQVPVSKPNTIVDKLIANKDFVKLYNYPQLGQGVKNAIHNKTWTNASKQALNEAKKVENALYQKSFSGLREELNYYQNLASSFNIYDYLFDKNKKEQWWGIYNAVKYYMSATKWSFVSKIFQETLIYQASLLKKETLKQIRDAFLERVKKDQEILQKNENKTISTEVLNTIAGELCQAQIKKRTEEELKNKQNIDFTKVLLG